MQPDEAGLGGSVVDALLAWDSDGLVVALQRPPTGTPNGDVDVLVSPTDLTRAEASLRDAGWLMAPSAGHGSHRFWVLRDPGSGEWHHLDLVTSLDFGPTLAYRTRLAETCLARRRRRGGLPCLHPDDTFWLALLHQAWKDDTSPRRGRILLAARHAAVDGPVADFLAGRLRGGTAELERLLAAVRREDWPAVSAVLSGVRRRWRRAHGPGVLAHHLRNTVLRRLPGREVPGETIALLGLDGAGKTTVGSRLHDEVPWPTVWMYMGVWTESRLDRLVRPVIGAQLVLRLGRLSRIAALTRYHRRMGRVVLLDRYVVDATLPSPDLDWKGRVSAVFVQRTAAVPDRLVFLDAPEEVAFARKGELTFDEARDRREHYQALARSSPRWVTVDAAQPLDDVVAEVGRIVWDDLRVERGSAEQSVVPVDGVTPQGEVAVVREGRDELGRRLGS